MATVQSGRPAQTRCAETAAPSAWDALREHLQGIKRDLLREIEHYPPPIPACDAQFNYLLERRDRIAEELRRLDAVCSERPTGSDDLAAWDAFIETSEFIHADTAQALRERLAR